MEMKFYRCAHCGQIVAIVKKTGVPVICCGEPMQELRANETDGAKEKHVPDVKVEGGIVKVQVGSVAHPMLEEHYIVFIALETENGFQIKYLNPGEAPTAEFALGDEKPVAVYEFCNLHGLWKAEI